MPPRVLAVWAKTLRGQLDLACSRLRDSRESANMRKRVRRKAWGLGRDEAVHVKFFWQNLQVFEGWNAGLTVDAVEEVLENMKISPRSHSEIVGNTRARNLRTIPTD